MLAVTMQHTTLRSRRPKARLADIDFKPSAISTIENGRWPVPAALECQATDRLIVAGGFIIELSAAYDARGKCFHFMRSLIQNLARQYRCDSHRRRRCRREG